LIRTERLLIREITAGDAESVRSVWEDFARSPYSCYDAPTPADAAESERRVRRMAESNRGERDRFWGVLLDRVIIGYVELHRSGDEAEIGYCFHSAYHRKGYASESCRALIGCYRDAGVKRFTAGCALCNTPSAELLRSLGFRLIGTEKVSFYKDENGEDVVFEGGLFELTF